MSDLSSTSIEELERRVVAAQTALRSAKQELDTARVAACGVSVGQVVKHKKTGILYRVVGIDTSWKHKPWLRGNPKKVDGTWGASVRHIYDDWEAVEEREAARGT
jgi:hypothetical protein